MFRGLDITKNILKQRFHDTSWVYVDVGIPRNTEKEAGLVKKGK